MTYSILDQSFLQSWPQKSIIWDCALVERTGKIAKQQTTSKILISNFWTWTIYYSWNTIVQHLWFLTYSLQEVGQLDSVLYKAPLLADYACFQITQKFVQRDCLTSHTEDSMPCTNSKQSWSIQTHKNMDYSGWQHETLSLEIGLAAGQEIRSRAALYILKHVWINAQSKRLPAVLPSPLFVDMLLNSMLANTFTFLSVDSQGSFPGSECLTVFRLFKLTSADKKLQKDLDDLIQACLVKLQFWSWDRSL